MAEQVANTRLTIQTANELAKKADYFVDEWTKETHKTLAEKVDRCIGGWPSDAAQLMFFHGPRREMEFTRRVANNGWWTTVLTAQEYYHAKAGLPEPDQYRRAVKCMQVCISSIAHQLESLTPGGK